MHILGTSPPAVSLMATDGRMVAMDEVPDATSGVVGRVLFFYPRTGVPGERPNSGPQGEEWESVPGARGCTPQSCGFCDLHGEFRSLGIEVYGISTSTSEHQREFVTRNHVPFPMLSDCELRLTRAMRLPTFQWPVESGGPSTLIKRMAWYLEPARMRRRHWAISRRRIFRDWRVRKVWYPIFPPDRNAGEVLSWCSARRAIRIEPITTATREFVVSQATRHFSSPEVHSLGIPYDTRRLDGFVARMAGAEVSAPLVGHVTVVRYTRDGVSFGEVVTLVSEHESAGVGAALLDAATDWAIDFRVQRLILTTTNDNLRALGFYQRRGWRIVAVHAGAMDRVREMGKLVPLVASNGLPIRDEIELEYWPIRSAHGGLETA